MLRNASGRTLNLGIAFLLLAPVPVLAQRGSGGYVPQIYEGQRALRQKHWTSAAQHFRYALIWNRGGVAAHNGLGSVYLGLGEVERAREEFMAALRQDPHSAEAERGIHEARTPGEEEAAFQDLERQVKQHPNDADLLTTYAEELVERNRLTEARTAANAALKLNPRLGHAHCALGQVAAREGNDATAVAELKQAVRSDHTDDDAWMTLGDLAMKAKEYRQAADYYRQVVQLLPDETEGYKKRIEALTAAGDTREAEHLKALLARLKGV